MKVKVHLSSSSVCG